MKVVLGGIVKNISKNIQQIKDFLESLKGLLPQLEVCLYENNSTDSTQKYLSILENKHNWIEVKSETLTNEFFFSRGKARTWDNLPCRIEMIAYARNQLLDMVNKKNLTKDDFFILMDLDVIIPPDIKVIHYILNNFPNNIDVLFANGIDKDERYYDSYELRTEAYPFGPEILKEYFWSKEHMDTILKKIEYDEPFIPVISAFGGLAIYRGNIFKDCFYSADVTDELHEFYLRQKLPESNNNPITHNEGILLGCYLKDDKIFYWNNSGYSYPICAEHVNFHLQIRKKGFKNMFICPFLYYYWL